MTPSRPGTQADVECFRACHYTEKRLPPPPIPRSRCHGWRRNLLPAFILMRVPRDPGYNAGMNAKSRYRLQLKLQAALARVVQVLARCQQGGVVLNATNIIFAASVADLLGTALLRAGEDETGQLRMEDFSPEAVHLAARVVTRRRKETNARKKRKRRRDPSG